MPSGSDWGGSSRGSAKDRRTRLYNAMVNRNTGEVRRPNQRAMFRAGNDVTFRQNRYTGKHTAQYNLPF